MKFFTTRKKIVAAVTTAALVVSIGGAAFAYFTSNAAGDGSAATGSAAGLTITQVGTVSGLTPAGPAKTINFNILNPAGNGAQNLGVVSVTVTSVTSGTLSTEACATSMYTTTPSTPVGTIAVGGSYSGTATISMTDDTNNQDNCQLANLGGALTLHFAAAQGS